MGMRRMTRSNEKIKVLLIGPLMDKIGGTTVSFRLLAKELENWPDIETSVLSVGGIRGGRWKALPLFFNLIFRIIQKTRQMHVISLHASITGVPYIGPVVFLISRIFRRPLVFRMFGGMDHNGLTGIKSKIAYYFAKKVDLYLPQTKLLVNSAADQGFNNAEWFPTCRPVHNTFYLSKRSCRRFVFVGQLRPEKGLKELAEAAERLPDGYIVHVYGPWTGLQINFFDSYRRIKLKGVLRPEEVTPTLKRYDALVLPTYLDEEGYSGVIFEAYSNGLPVIATKWLALPEIVLNEETGLLVEPFSSESLLTAMLRLAVEQELYFKLCEGAFSFVQDFSVESQAERFLKCCRQVLHARTDCPHHIYTSLF